MKKVSFFNRIFRKNAFSYLRGHEARMTMMKKLAYFAMMAAVVAAFSFGSKAEARVSVSLNVGVGAPYGPVVVPAYPAYPAYPVRPMLPPPPIIVHPGHHHHHHHCHPMPHPCPPPCPPRHHGGCSGAIHPRLR